MPVIIMKKYFRKQAPVLPLWRFCHNRSEKVFAAEICRNLPNTSISIFGFITNLDIVFNFSQGIIPISKFIAIIVSSCFHAFPIQSFFDRDHFETTRKGTFFIKINQKFFLGKVKMEFTLKTKLWIMAVTDKNLYWVCQSNTPPVF